MSCTWLVKVNGKWQRCQSRAVTKSDLDDSLLCRHHKANEWLAIGGKKVDYE
jgi:hypothetical protein